MFWIMVAAMTAVVALAIALPFLRRARGAEPAAAYDLRVYRDQLREVDRDLSRGVLSADDAERLHTEIGRKVLDADRALSRQTTAPRGPGGTVALVLLGGLLAGSAALYALDLGQPGAPDEPLAARKADAGARYAARPTQAQAEKDAPPVTVPPADAEYTRLIEQLRQTVAQRPDDPRGFALLAQHEARLGNLVAAKDAQARLIAVLGDKADATEHARLAALMIEAAGGLVTAEAEAEISRTLQMNPDNREARYMQGLLYAQNGRPDRTFPIWAELLARGPEDAPWIAPIRATIGDLAWLAGQPGYTPPEPSGAAAGADLPGPDAAAAQAAADMTPAERQQMIAGMVEQLETRLTTSGGSGAEWARLIGALNVLGDTDKARAMLDRGRTALADHPDDLATLNAAAGQAGLE